MEPLGVAALVAAAGGGLVLGIKGVITNRRRAADEFHLRQAGRLVTARVTAVAPMDRSVNRAAGHPVTLTLPTGGGYERSVQDTSGLGGYVVREGGAVQVRVSPDDPDLLRIEQIIGPAGPYPIHKDDQPPGGNGLPYAMLAVPVLIGAGALTVWQLGEQALLALLPPIFLIIGVGLLVGAVRSARSQRRLTAEATGVVTEVWTESQRRGGRRGGSTQVYAYTVHFFTPDGREVHRRHPHANNLFRPQPQQQVTVRYNPAHPPEFGRGGAALTNTLVLALVGVVFATVGVCGLGILTAVINSQ